VRKRACLMQSVEIRPARQITAVEFHFVVAGFLHTIHESICWLAGLSINSQCNVKHLWQAETDRRSRVEWMGRSIRESKSDRPRWMCSREPRSTVV